MITVEQARRKLKKEVNRQFTKAEQMDLLFRPDQLNQKTVTWFMEDKKSKIEMICLLRTGIVTTCTTPL